MEEINTQLNFQCLEVRQLLQTATVEDRDLLCVNWPKKIVRRVNKVTGEERIGVDM